MSARVLLPEVVDITNKWELAQRFFGHTKAPEYALQSVFDAVMQELERTAHTTFESPVKERAWKAISGQRLKDIREDLMLEFCDQVLGSFSEKEAAEILEEHTRTGVVKNSWQIYAALAFYQESIVDIVAQKASSMLGGLIPELIDAVEKEGIQLSKPKRKKRSFSTAIPSSAKIPIPKNFKTSHFNALTQAVETGDVDKVSEALQNGANPNGSLGTQNIVHLACEMGNVDIVLELLNYGAGLNSKSSQWADTPLHRACVFGHTAVVAILIARGAIVNIRNINCWQTPLECAITFKYFDCCKLLVQAGAKVNGMNHAHGSTPLMTACSEGSYEIVELLLDAGANPNLRSSSGTTPLYWAVHSPTILQLMLDRGAKANVQNDPGSHDQASQYPIHAAASYGYDESVNILLKAGADPKVRDGQGKTPVELARRELNNHRTNPCNPPEETAEMIRQLEKVIGLLEAQPEHA